MADGIGRTVDEKIAALTSTMEGIVLIQAQQQEEIASLHSSLEKIVEALAKLSVTNTATIAASPVQNSDSILRPHPNRDDVEQVADPLEKHYLTTPVAVYWGDAVEKTLKTHVLQFVNSDWGTTTGANQGILFLRGDYVEDYEVKAPLHSLHALHFLSLICTAFNWCSTHSGQNCSIKAEFCAKSMSWILKPPPLPPDNNLSKTCNNFSYFDLEDKVILQGRIMLRIESSIFRIYLNIYLAGLKLISSYFI